MTQPSQSGTEYETLREQVQWMVARCNEAMGDGFAGTPNSAVAAVCDEVIRLREEVHEACSGLGVAIPLMTPEQIAKWMARMRRFHAESEE